MPRPIVMPSLGMYTTEGTIAAWLLAPGSSVATGDPIIEIETEKETYEIAAPGDGIFQPTAAIGDVIADEGLIGYVIAPGEETPGAEPPSATPGAESTTTPDQASSAAPPAEPLVPHHPVRASPRARNLARKHGIDLSTLTGTGPGERITDGDVLAVVATAPGPDSASPETVSPAAPSTPSAEIAAVSDGSPSQAPASAALTRSGETTRVPFTGTRRAIADRLRRVLSTAAPVTLTREIDAEALWTVREQLKTGFPEGLPFDAIFVKVIAASLVEYPALNAMIDGDEIVRFDHVHVGVAVATPDGLYVPVVREAETRVLREIASDIIRLSGKARARQLSGDDMAGGTVAITNLGNYGVDAFTPIINPPQSAILGIGRILQRAVVRDGQLTARRTCALSLTFDHRVADGAPAAQLLDAIASKVEDEGRLRGLLDA